MKKIETILIANRGEISSRVARTSRNMGIRSVAVYSDADKDAPFVGDADMAVHIGPSSVAESYLNQEKIIAAAKAVGADAIHPGYGFLSENAAFAKLCVENDICWIGPHPEAIHSMGSKSLAKQMMIDHGVPTVPGYQGKEQSEAKLQDEAAKIGYPLLLKATAGGGGKGMRVAENEADLTNALEQAAQEAEAAFGNGGVYLEKFVDRPRHVEVQVLADHHGNTVHLWERDCSTQRRHQKLIEESPAPTLPEKTRKDICDAAVRMVEAADYHNAGTVEFIVDKDHNFYFIEVNARIQVEHPVSEMVTGIDLIQQQIKVAAGEKLSFSQDDIKCEGVAMECRINAEDPEKNFQPCPGLIKQIHIPGGMGVRWDSHVHAGYTVPPHYDSMVGKLIVHRPTRAQAIATMIRALKELRIEGIKTSADFQVKVLESQDFVDCKVDTKWVERDFLA